MLVLPPQVDPRRTSLLWRLYPYCYDLGVSRLAPYRQLQWDVVSAVRWRLEALKRSDGRRLALLDVCCGTGNTLSGMLRCFPEADAVGIDFSPAMLRHARHKCRRLGRLRLISAPAAEGLSGLPSAAFDAVTLCNGLYALPDRLGVLRQIRRLVRDDGLFVLTDPTTGARLSWLLREHLEREGPGGVGTLPLMVASAMVSGLLERHPGHRFCEPSEIRRLVRHAGFDILSEARTYGGANLLLMCRPTANAPASAEDPGPARNAPV